MLIIESTHRLSPISSEIGMVGQSRAMLVSPLGRAYLSHSSKKRRDVVLARLRAVAQPDDCIIGDSDAIDRMVEAGRRDGFSICQDLPHERRASMAVPVCVDGEAVASLNIVWQVADMTFQQARERLAKPLLAARDRIEALLREMAEEGPAFLFDDAYIRRTPTALCGLSGIEALRAAAI